jgi:hypothetical protein
MKVDNKRKDKNYFASKPKGRRRLEKKQIQIGGSCREWFRRAEYEETQTEVKEKE